MRIALLFALLAVAVFPASAGAKKDRSPWATVNVCDTTKQPDSIGIRAAMAGTPRGARLTMRFRVQYRDRRGGWQDVDDADSGWRRVGYGKGAQVESGWSFTFARPARTVVLRGVVKFRWRRGNSLPRTAEVATEAGHRSSAGADPPGYSAATCALGS
jgi:hypothetical protein